MTLDLYAHFFDEFDVSERVSAEEQEIPANPHSPICLPRISFMTPEHGTGEHAGSTADINPLQMELFDAEADDRT